MRRRAAAASLALMLAAGSVSGCAEYTTTGVAVDEPTLDAIGEQLAPAVDALTGSAWDLSSSAAEGIDLTSYPITAVFADGQLTGAAPVNTYSTTYTLADGASSEGGITLGAIATTKRAGTKAQMVAESAFLALLGTVTEFHLDGEHLALAAGERTVLEFDQQDPTTRALAATAAFAATLVGKQTEAAMLEAQQAGYTLRVVSEDGVTKVATSDLVTDRINVEVDKGVVIKVTAG